MSASGTLFLIVGPSGVGKDSLIAYCRARLAGTPHVVFPRRSITRPRDHGSEEHEPLSEEEFASAVASGRFALSWRAHGFGYGIPASIAEDLSLGRGVVANVSRTVIEQAQRRFASTVVVSVRASAEVLAARLRARGREDEAGAAGRLSRADAFRVEGPNVVHLDNSGELAAAGEALVGLIAPPGWPAGAGTG